MIKTTRERKMKSKLRKIPPIKKIELTIRVEEIMNRMEIRVEEEGSKIMKDLLEMKNEKEFFWARIYAPRIKLGEIKGKIEKGDEININILYENENVQEQIVKKYMLNEEEIVISGIKGKITKIKFFSLEKMMKNAMQMKGKKVKCKIKFLTPMSMVPQKEKKTRELTFENILKAIKERMEIIEKKKEKMKEINQQIKNVKKEKIELNYIDIRGTYINEELMIVGKIGYKIDNINEESLKLLVLGEFFGVGKIDKENMGIMEIEVERL